MSDESEEPTLPAITRVDLGSARGMTNSVASSHSLGARRARVWRRVIAIALLVAVLASVGAAIADASNRYAQARTAASDGMRHLTAARALITPLLAAPGVPDASTLAQLRREIAAAQSDFTVLSRDLGSGTIALAHHVPGVGGTVGSAADLASAAEEACTGVLELLDGAQILLPAVNGGIFASSTTGAGAGLTGTALAQLRSDYEHGVAHLGVAVQYASQADLSALPASLVPPKDAALLRQAISSWPTIYPQLAKVDSWLAAAPTLLGASTPMNYLLEFMDRSELRPTGGFIGNYAVMTVTGGKVQPFTLTDVYLLDGPNARQHQAPPAAYAWWPFGAFGLRDSNLSLDFPTSATLGMQQFEREGGPAVQGVIAFTPVFVEQVLNEVGPISVPEYGETVTAKNLEAIIHHYQETQAYQAGSDLPPTDQVSSLQKRFTALLGRALMSKLHALTPHQLSAIGKDLLTSLRTKDVQIYVSDKPTEALLAQQGWDGAIARGPGDAVSVVDANISANKANLFTTVSYVDYVALDANGTATHKLTITYHFSANDPTMTYLLYGRDHYLTYLRLYMPPGAVLAHQDGFQLDQHNTKSDQQGRTMWAGLVDVGDGVPAVLHLTWSVPKAATRDASGRWHYTLVFQHQAGSTQQLALTMTTPGSSHPAISYQGPLDSDQAFVIGS